MTIEYLIVVFYLVACVAIGIIASFKVMASKADYWVAGRKIGTWVNSMAIMAALASGGSIVGVMGLAYAKGIPFTLAMFAGAVVGFPLAAILVAKPLRNFGKFTITDFLVFRFPNPVVRTLVPSLIVVCFTIYIVAQMKAAGITAEALLGMKYHTAVTCMTLVFIIYVSIGGMLAVTWTDVFQGLLMILVILGCSAALIIKTGSPHLILTQATQHAPQLGQVFGMSQSSYVGAFVLWATAIPVIPHIVMRVFSAKNAESARLSLNWAMVLYSLMILAAVFIIVPVGKINFPTLEDADTVFLRVMGSEFPALIRGLAVAAVMAAVMSTTDALLLACGSSVTHDLLGPWLDKRFSLRATNLITITIVWIIGLLAMVLAYSPPALLTVFYSSAIGILAAAFFVPTIAGIWWKRANTSGAVASLVAGTGVYLYVQLGTQAPAFSAIVVALPVSAVAMWVGSLLGHPTPLQIQQKLSELHKKEF